jgi:heparan-alpha-glucosaminide N-acetyltransferase
MSDAIKVHQQTLEGRIDSVDVMRGFTILVMAFVNDMADFAPVKDVPQWMHHMAAGINGFTFVDLIVPVFMLIMGISIPLALGKRLARGESKLRVFGHVLLRCVSLIIMGLMDVNRGAGLGRPYGDMLDWPHGLWKFLAWTFIFIVWLDIPLKSTLAKNWNRVLKIAGLLGLVWLAVVFRNPNGGHFTTSWWGTLGELGWAYLLASTTWLIFRNNRIGILGVFVLFHCMYLAIQDRLFRGVWLVGWLVSWIGASALGTATANTVAGLIIGTLLLEQSGYREKIRTVLSVALFTGIAAILLQKVGGLRSPNSTWSLSATTAGFAIWALLYWCIDIKGWKRGLDSIRTIGR